ncbi:MAG: hypothetical protein ACKOD9_22410 [Rubrivivax sp.]
MPPKTSHPRIALIPRATLAALLLGGWLASAAADARDPGSTRSASTQATQPAAIEVVSARFGVFGVDPSGRRILLETDSFPAIAAAPYGWYIVYKASKPTVVWREEFELPVSLDNWGPGEAMGIYTISPDRKTAVTERVVPTGVGFIANQWRFAPGDPMGAHAMRVYIDGQLIRDFRFRIDDDPAARPRTPSPQGGRRGPMI